MMKKKKNQPETFLFSVCVYALICHHPLVNSIQFAWLKLQNFPIFAEYFCSRLSFQLATNSENEKDTILLLNVFSTHKSGN